jgi:hypothetical protein
VLLELLLRIFFVLSGLSCFVSVAAAAVKLGQSRRPFSSPP